MYLHLWYHFYVGSKHDCADMQVPWPTLDRHRLPAGWCHHRDITTEFYTGLWTWWWCVKSSFMCCIPSETSCTDLQVLYLSVTSFKFSYIHFCEKHSRLFLSISSIASVLAPDMGFLWSEWEHIRDTEQTFINGAQGSKFIWLLYQTPQRDTECMEFVAQSCFAYCEFWRQLIITDKKSLQGSVSSSNREGICRIHVSPFFFFSWLWT